MLILFSFGCTGLLVRWSVADHLARKPDLTSVARAVSMAPAQTRYLLREAAMLQRLSPFDPAARSRVQQLLEKAAQSAPLLADPWMQMGMFYEGKGDAAKAETLLLHAEAVDHTFKPAWTLANFYLRQGRDEKFWASAQRALALTEPGGYEPEPVFDLCWRVTPDPATILKLAIPHKPWVTLAYARYLIHQDQPAAALEAWRTVAREDRMKDTFTAALLCDRLLSANNSDGAVEVWNTWRPDARLDPNAGVSLTNGSLAKEPSNRGFDWHIIAAQGAQTQYFADGHEIRTEFDGDEAENAELLTQLLPVVPGAKYRFSCDYLTADVPPDTGLTWAVSDVANTSNATSTCGSLSSNDRTTASCEFSVPAQKLVKLALRYQRKLGTRHIRGTIRVSNMKLEKIS